jgi:hypothetical protein
MIQESRARQEQYQLQYAQEAQQEEEDEDELNKDEEDEVYRRKVASSSSSTTVTAYPGTLEHYIQTRQQFLNELRQLEPGTFPHPFSFIHKHTRSLSFCLSLTLFVFSSYFSFYSPSLDGSPTTTTSTIVVTSTTSSSFSVTTTTITTIAPNQTKMGRKS